jgi:hypothetical protein
MGAQPAGEARVREPVSQPAGGRGHEGRVRGLTRRSFLRTGSLGAVGVGLIGSVPGLSGLLGFASADAPGLSAAGSEADSVAPEVSGPIIAHVTDASAGEVSLYIGEREVAYRDPVLVQHLLRAAN